MKLTIAQWGLLLLQANQAAEMQKAVAEGANEVLSAYASASGKAVPEIARLIQTPTIRPETIMEVAASIDEQARGIEDAVRFGQQARADVVTAIAREPLALPAGPQLPASVLDHAPDLLPVKR